MDFKNIIICSDYDGTLTSPSLDIKKEAARKINNICNENVDAINLISAAGGRFVVASGRSPLTLLHLYDTLNIDDVFAGVNGTAMYSVSQKKFIYRHEMREKAVDIVKTVFSVAPKLVGYQVFDYDANVHIWTENEGDPIKFAEKFDRALKVIFFEDNADIMSKIQTALQQTFSTTCAFSKSWSNLLECNDFGAGKADIVNWFRKNNPDKTIVALGDYENDIGMLKAADYSFCPKNAVDRVKEVCDRVFRSSGDGFLMDVVDYLRKL